MLSLLYPIDVEITDLEEVLARVRYLNDPLGLQILRGTRVRTPGVIEIDPEGYAAEVSVPRPDRPFDAVLPVRVRGLNTRWAAGLWLKQGYVKGDHGEGVNRYRALGLDFDGNAYVPLHVDLAALSHVVAGHPVVADTAGRELFIEVVKLGEKPFTWHVSVNNPTDRTITARLTKAIALPGLLPEPLAVTLQPGEYRVLEGKEQ